MNLYEETKQVLQENGKRLKDIKWVGSAEGHFPVTKFLKLAKQAVYNPGYGASKVAQDLIVCGEDWWLERGEYDGSEWWEFKEQPKKPKNCFLRGIFALTIDQSEAAGCDISCGWETLVSLNTLEEKSDE